MELSEKDIQELRKAWKIGEIPTGTQKHGCGTGLFTQLNTAMDAYHNQQPLSENVVVDEVIMHVYDEWTKVGVMYSNDNEEGEDVVTPRISIDGETTEVQLYLPDEINNFLPQRGHEYELLVRRFRLKTHLNSSHYVKYELIRIICDTK